MVMSSTYVARREFRAMGTDCSILIYGSDPRVESLADLAKHRVDLLESLWSRFRPESELSRVNERAGSGEVSISAETEALIRAMRSGWEMTRGAFDPTVLTAVRANGYDRTFTDIVETDNLQTESFRADDCRADDFATGMVARDFVSAVSEPAPGMADVTIGERVVALPGGVGLDPGAIGKGLAADIVVDEMIEAGARGVLVDLGGDIAFAGSPGEDPQWRIAIFDEGSREDGTNRLHVVPAKVAHAGIATSTSLTRRWARGRHHVIDPGTGLSTDEALVQATAAGDRAWECEVWATAMLVRPQMLAELPEQMSCTAFSTSGVHRDDFPSNSEQGQVA